MKQTGILATCDRCGKTKFFAEGKHVQSSDLYNCSRWDVIGMRNVCPECYNEYNERRNKMTEEYWNYKKEVKNNDRSDISKSVSMEQWEDVSG